MHPQLEEFGEQKDNVFVRFIDVTDIRERRLPVAEQHGIEAVPHFVLVDPDGNILEEGAGVSVWESISERF